METESMNDLESVQRYHILLKIVVNNKYFHLMKECYLKDTLQRILRTCDELLLGYGDMVSGRMFLLLPESAGKVLVHVNTITEIFIELYDGAGKRVDLKVRK